jgi:hypothetical protein
MAKFLAHMAQAIGAAPGSLEGAYLPSRARCDAYATERAAVFAVLDTDTLLAHASDWKARPLAHLGTATKTTWYVVAPKGTLTSPADLAGKSIQSTAPGGARFVANLVLDGAVPISALVLEGTAKPLRALRKVARGQAAAAIVDQDAMAALGELTLPVELVVVAKSRPLPGLTLASIEAGDSKAPEKLVQGIRKSLSTLCEGRGQKLCKTLGVQRFTATSDAWFEALRARYAR